MRVALCVCCVGEGKCQGQNKYYDRLIFVVCLTYSSFGDGRGILVFFVLYVNMYVQTFIS